ncbi:MAG TPA: SAM-dependent methyltransferase [Micromonosporaceae bacterium]|nr:SAM-dependent methyltransferase [Micromonosporaceae bacterium]
MAIPEDPNTGRIIDYWLGGGHHLPADVNAAKAFELLYPGFPQVFATLREFLGRAVRAVADQGTRQYLVLGSGVPTRGNVHEVVQARVLYTDVDLVNIELGKQILAGLPHVDYAYCDAADLGTLDQDAVRQILDPTQPVGVVMVGVLGFLDDRTAQKTLSETYDWAPSGSYLVADFDGEAMESHPAVLSLVHQAGGTLYLRRPEQIRPLLGRWQLTPEGVQPVDLWRNHPPTRLDRVFMYGCLAAKP